MTDEDDVVQVEAGDNVEDILSVSLERRISLRIVGAEIGAAGSDIIEKDDSIVVLEGGNDEPPHVLIASKAMREHHRLHTAAEDLHVVAPDDFGRRDLAHRHGRDSAFRRAKRAPT